MKSRPRGNGKSLGQSTGPTSTLLRSERLEERRLLSISPKVVAVEVSSTAWLPQFSQFARDFTGGVTGYRIPAGTSSFAQALPYTGLDQVSIAFSEPVEIFADDLHVWGVQTREYAFKEFAYNPSTRIATWTLKDVLARDRVLLDLSSSVHDLERNALDGEVVGVNQALPSGNGQAFGDFLYQFNVLPGDADRNGSVLAGLDLRDFSILRSTFGRRGAGLQADFNGDAKVDLHDFAVIRLGFGTRLPAGVPSDPAAKIESISPSPFEELVSLTREIIVNFDGVIDPASVTSDSIYLIANGEKLPGTLRVSSTREFATLFPASPLPASTEVRVAVDGDRIQGADGKRVDADGDGAPGGMGTADFRTLPITLIKGTKVFGRIYDSYNKIGDDNIPVVGATISLDARPDIKAVTDANGFFELTSPDGLPAPEFFVHIDGSTATNAPVGTKYATLGKPFHSVPGQRVQISHDGTPFDIFLPPMAMGDIVPLPANQDTTVGFGTAAQAQIRKMFAERYPEDAVRASREAQLTIDAMQVTYPAGSAQDQSGGMATQATVVPVDPARLPAPLPGGVNPALVISIQAGTQAGFNLSGGSTNFDTPAPVTFPNLEGLAPGEKSLIWSFDHDAGEWKVVGTGTVSADGKSIVSDGGVIEAPGWHFTQSGTEDCGHIVEERETYSVGVQASFKWEPVRIGYELEFAMTPYPGLEFKYENVLSIPERPVEGARTIQRTVNVPAKYGTYFPEGEFSIGSIEAKVGIVGQLAATLNVEVDAGETEVDLEGKIAANVVTTASFQFKDSLLCAMPEIGDDLCDQYELPEIRLLGTPTFEINEDDFTGIHLPYALPAQFQATVGPNFQVGITSQLTASAKAFIRKLTLPSGVVSQNGTCDNNPSNDQINQPTLNGQESIAPPRKAAYVSYVNETGSIRNKSDLRNNSRTVLQPNTDYDLYIYDSASGRSGVFEIASSANGNSIGRVIELGNEAMPDSDNDGIPDVGETAIGTSPDRPDTDNDGINDLAEIQQGLDPFGGRAFPTGVISTLPLRGDAKQVVLEGSTLKGERQTAYVATGTYGLAVVDASQFNNPIVLGQLDLPGDSTDVAVDSRSNIAVTASNQGGVNFVDIADSMLPKLLGSVNVTASRVEVVDGVAYLAASNQLYAYDVLTREFQQSIDLPLPITDLALEAGYLYAMTESGHLHMIDISGPEMFVVGSLDMPGTGGTLFVGGGVAYAAAAENFRGGYATAAVGDPDNLRLISTSDVSSPFIAPKTAVASNGAGVGVVIGSAGSVNTIDVIGMADPANTDVAQSQFRTRFQLDSPPTSVALAAGVGFITSGAGLQVINYSAFDVNRQRPTVQVTTPEVDVDATAPGVQVTEGSQIPVQAVVRDDVQVRNVELLVDGEVVRNDVSFPFDLTVTVPRRSANKSSVRVQVRATDTGGNIATSEELVWQLVPDTFAPRVVRSLPGDGGIRFEGHQSVRLVFSEPMDIATLRAENFTLTRNGAPEVNIAPIDVQARRGGREIQITYPSLVADRYTFGANNDRLSDIAGNQLAEPAFSSTFEIIVDRDPGDTLRTALPLGPLDSDKIYSDEIGKDAIGGADAADVYSFSLSTANQVAVSASGLAGGNEYAQFYLGYDANRNGVWEDVEDLEKFDANTSGSMVQDLAPGRYYVWVRPYNNELSRNTRYTLGVKVSA